MDKKKYISKILIAAFFLASYSGVYATYFLCNIVPLVSAKVSGVHNHADHDHHHESDTDNHSTHSSDNHKASGTHNHDSHSHDHSGSTTMDECCNDQTVPFINSLPKLSLKQFHLEFAVSHVLITHSYRIIDKPFLKIYPKLVRYIRPPPKVPDIRIFIQSFII